MPQHRLVFNPLPQLQRSLRPRPAMRPRPFPMASLPEPTRLVVDHRRMPKTAIHRPSGTISPNHLHFSSFHSSAPSKGEVQTMAMTDVPTKLGYLINDADEHSTPRPKAYEDYIDPDKRDMAIRSVRLDDGRRVQLFNGRPQRFDMGKDFQVTFSNDTLDELGVSGNGGRQGRRRRRPGDERCRQPRPGLAAQPAEPSAHARRSGPQGVRAAVPRAAGAARQPGRPPRGDGRPGRGVRGELRRVAGYRGGVRGRLRRALRRT